MSRPTAASVLNKRLELLGINEDTKNSMKKVRPILYEEIDNIIGYFYDHIFSFPEIKKLFPGVDSRRNLEVKQKHHWISLFSCNFDESYLQATTRIGKAHFENKIAPYIYISGYNFFLCELTKIVSIKMRDSADLPGMLTSIVRLVSLDMDLSMSFYTREYWKMVKGNVAKGEVVSI